MQRHQPILMQDPCVRFLFPADVVSFDFIPGETLGDVAARFGGLGLKRYGKAMAIDITLPAKRRLD